MTRRVGLLAALALLLLLVGGSSAAGGADSPTATPVATPVDGSDGRISPRPDTSGPSLTAVEPGRTPVLARSDSRPTAWALAAALLVFGFVAAAAIDRRRGILRRLLELTIRARTEWWHPTPGGRAPPHLLPV